MIDNAYILDNGAYSAKVGLSCHEEPKIIPNCIMKAKSERQRPFIGNQIEDCRDASGLFYILPFTKGYLVNWDVQKTVWDYILSNDCCPSNFSESPVIITEPYFNFNPIKEAMSEIFFEEYECQSFLRVNAGDLSVYHYNHDNPGTLCVLLVETGYSFTHIVPYIQGKKIRNKIRRIDVGGKILTNHIKEIISYRQLHVMDETYVMNQVKEDCCFVSEDFSRDVEIARKKYPENTIVRDYALPDYTTIRRGYIRPLDSKEECNQQTIRLNIERFSVPEVLFHPSDLGINQMGIPEAIVRVIKSCPEETQPHLFNNILITGGCAAFPGFKTRVYNDVRSMAPYNCKVRVTVPDNPVTYAWHGGVLFSKDPKFYNYAVTKEEYEKEGHAVIFERFDEANLNFA
ncbi:unnamed protein product [Bemisia tabaci]|uniref:Actin-related protein 6 n=1 Tax=Bemisia tabaci TaxID=7038 RepID=A0A9P0A651_BEMTA|nr:PREDICTED: actin-related protein 6 [Bemisia tabaci]CAH0387288.1 unnamed protein product [Bemisia tabaci]